MHVSIKAECVLKRNVDLGHISRVSNLESISLSSTVARLSVITTESSRIPAVLPMGEFTVISMRLG